uniref:cofilin-2-like n=1 Tax=Pristiophorus japonicus TaxID=55135 RepID=UPI00398F7042
MSSGISVCDEVVTTFNKMKVRKSCSQEEQKKRKKAVLFRISDNKEKIILYEHKEILIGDIQEGKVVDPLQTFIDMLPQDDCCYAIYDASFETKETRKEELIFVHWNPDSATVRRKMLYASSKDALKKKLEGIKHEWQVTGIDELNDLAALGCKLAPDVVTVESRPVSKA